MDGEGKFQRVSGTNVGGGTYWGLGRLLTKCKRLLRYLNLHFLTLPFLVSISDFPCLAALMSY